MKKEYKKPEMMLVLLQTYGILAASLGDTVESTVTDKTLGSGFWSDASEYSGNGGDEDW